MTFDEFTVHTMPLAVLLGAEWDAPTWRLYHRAVESIPLPVYVAAIAKAAETRTSKFPTAGALRELAEGCRQEMRALMKFQPCANCSKDGWTERTIDGTTRAVRCSCWQAHQQRVAALGIGSEPLALPQGRSSDWTQVGDDAA